MVDVGDKAPQFSAPDENSAIRSLKDYRGKILVLYFYPKDLTSACTVQACNFRDNLGRITRTGASLLGVSPDPPKRHRKFIDKESLNFPLISDEDHAISLKYDVWKEKSMYGRKYMGIERSTFVIDGKGIIRAAFRKLTVAGHVDQVLDALSLLKKK